MNRLPILLLTLLLSGCEALRTVPEASFSYESREIANRGITISCSRGLQPSQAAELTRLLEAFSPAMGSGEGVLKRIDSNSDVPRVDLALQICIRLLDAAEQDSD